MNKLLNCSRLLVFAMSFFLQPGQNVFAQGVSINANGDPPHSSASLDVSGTTQGVLINRMTTAQRDAIVSPAEGLMIFNTTTKCFEFFAFGLWQTGNCAVCPLPGAAGTISGSASVCQGQNGVSYSVTSVNGANSYSWN